MGDHVIVLPRPDQEFLVLHQLEKFQQAAGRNLGLVEQVDGDLVGGLFLRPAVFEQVLDRDAGTRGGAGRRDTRVPGEQPDGDPDKLADQGLVAGVVQRAVERDGRR